MARHGRRHAGGVPLDRPRDQVRDRWPNAFSLRRRRRGNGRRSVRRSVRAGSYVGRMCLARPSSPDSLPRRESPSDPDFFESGQDAARLVHWMGDGTDWRTRFNAANAVMSPRWLVRPDVQDALHLALEDTSASWRPRRRRFEARPDRTGIRPPLRARSALDRTRRLRKVPCMPLTFEGKRTDLACETVGTQSFHNDFFD